MWLWVNLGARFTLVVDLLSSLFCAFPLVNPGARFATVEAFLCLIVFMINCASQCTQVPCGWKMHEHATKGNGGGGFNYQVGGASQDESPPL